MDVAIEIIVKYGAIGFITAVWYLDRVERVKAQDSIIALTQAGITAMTEMTNAIKALRYALRVKDPATDD